MNYLTERPNRVNGGSMIWPSLPSTIDELFQRFWGTAPMLSRVDTWRPVVDIVENPQSYVLRLELPGVDPERVDVMLAGDTLTIRGEKSLEEKLEDEQWRLSERTAGRFERSFTFPVPVAADDVRAEARNGVLTVTVGKAKEARPHRITVKTQS